MEHEEKVKSACEEVTETIMTKTEVKDASFVDRLNWEFNAAKYQECPLDSTLDRTSATDFFNRTNGLGSPEYYAEKKRDLEEKENATVRPRTRSRAAPNRDDDKIVKAKVIDYETQMEEREKLKDRFLRRQSNEPTIVPERTDVKKNIDDGGKLRPQTRTRGVSPAPRTARAPTPTPTNVRLVATVTSSSTSTNNKAPSAANASKPLRRSGAVVTTSISTQPPPPPQIMTRSRKLHLGNTSTTGDSPTVITQPQRPLFRRRANSVHLPEKRAPVKLPPPPAIFKSTNKESLASAAPVRARWRSSSVVRETSTTTTKRPVTSSKSANSARVLTAEILPSAAPRTRAQRGVSGRVVDVLVERHPITAANAAATQSPTRAIRARGIRGCSPAPAVRSIMNVAVKQTSDKKETPPAAARTATATTSTKEVSAPTPAIVEQKAASGGENKNENTKPATATSSSTRRTSSFMMPTLASKRRSIVSVRNPPTFTAKPLAPAARYSKK